MSAIGNTSKETARIARDFREEALRLEKEAREMTRVAREYRRIALTLTGGGGGMGG